MGVLGLARSGLAAARALAAPAPTWSRSTTGPRLWPQTPFRPGVASDVADLALLLPSPGVPLTHPLIGAARSAGVPIRGDIDLFAEQLGLRPVIGITGTNGKSTTTALVHHLLVSAGVDA